MKLRGEDWSTHSEGVLCSKISRAVSMCLRSGELGVWSTQELRMIAQRVDRSRRWLSFIEHLGGTGRRVCLYIGQPTERRERYSSFPLTSIQGRKIPSEVQAECKLGELQPVRSTPQKSGNPCPASQNFPVRLPSRLLVFFCPTRGWGCLEWGGCPRKRVVITVPHFAL